MKVIKKYLLKEILISYLFSLIALVSLFSIFHLLDELENEYPFIEKLKYILFSIPSVANNIFPLAILVGAIVVIGRLNSNREIQIFLSGGFSILNLIKRTTLITLTISLISIFVGESFSPYFTERALRIKAIASGKNYSVSETEFWLKKDNVIVNLNKPSGSELINEINIYELDHEKKLKKFITSNEVNITQSQLSLIRPSQIEIKNLKGKYKFENIVSNQFDSGTSFTEKDINSLAKDQRTIMFFDLLDSIIFSMSNGLNNQVLISEFFTRVTKPLYALGMTLIAITFVINFDRAKSIGGGVFAGISLAIVFNLVTKLLNILSIKFGINIYVASLLPTLLILLLGLMFFYKKFGKYN